LKARANAQVNGLIYLIHFKILDHGMVLKYSSAPTIDGDAWLIFKKKLIKGLLCAKMKA
jgi:hypothetical protein